MPIIELHLHVKTDVEVLRRLSVVINKLDLLNDRQELIMATFEELKASQVETIALVGKVKTDVEALHAKLDAIPAGGMTPEQQVALDDAVTTAKAIVDSLSSVDGLTPDAA